MKQADLLKSLESGFDAHMEKLVDVLVTSIIDDPTQRDQALSRFTRGCSFHADARDRATAIITRLFPE